MSDEFATPATATGIPWPELEGRLLLFTVNALEPNIPTVFGEKEAIRADIAVIDGVEGQEDYRDGFVFPKVLQSQLRSSIGKRVLGRLGTGNAKPGQKPPWRLSDPTDDDKAAARKWISDNEPPPF